MKIEVTKTVEFNAKYLYVEAGVRHWEDAGVNGLEDEEGKLIPCRVGDLWKPVIDIDSGIIINWDIGREADIHYKVCDAGVYTVTDVNSNEIIKKDGYVPDCLSVDDNGYGDYIIMKVGADGKIENWKADLDDLIESAEGY